MAVINLLKLKDCVTQRMVYNNNNCRTCYLQKIYKLPVEESAQVNLQTAR